MERTGCIEWPDIGASTSDLHVVHDWCAGLLLWLRVSIHPTAISNKVQNLDIIDQREFRTFGDSDTALHKIARVHVY